MLPQQGIDLACQLASPFRRVVVAAAQPLAASGESLLAGLLAGQQGEATAQVGLGYVHAGPRLYRLPSPLERADPKHRIPDADRRSRLCNANQAPRARSSQLPGGPDLEFFLRQKVSGARNGSTKREG